MKIEVIGPGCPRCKKTEQHVKKALGSVGGLDADVTKVDDQMAIIDRGVMHTPAVAVDGDVVVSGEIPSVDQLVEILESR